MRFAVPYGSMTGAGLEDVGRLTPLVIMLRIAPSFREAGGTWPCDRLGNLRVEREGANASPAQAGSDGANDGWERIGGPHGPVPRVPRPARVGVTIPCLLWGGAVAWPRASRYSRRRLSTSPSSSSIVAMDDQVTGDPPRGRSLRRLRRKDQRYDVLSCFVPLVGHACPDEPALLCDVLDHAHDRADDQRRRVVPWPR